jgi:hypothetical protein
MGPDELDPAIKFLEECLKGERWAPRADRGRLQVAVVAVFSIAFALVVPLSFGAFAWPVVAFGLLTYWRRLQRRFSPPASEGGMLWRLGVATVIASAVISVARQCDPPVQLPSVTIKLAGKPVAPGARGPATASASAGAPAGGADERQRAGDAPPRTVTGILVTLTDENVAIGDADEGTITTYPRSRVTDLEIGPPLDRRSPPRSLLSSLMGGQAWGWTPLEFWCGGERYGWPRVADLCKGAPTVGLRTLTLEDGQVRGLRVLCPEAADRTCRGFLTLETVSPRQDPESGRRLPVQIEPVEFNVAQDDSAKVPLEVDQRRAERLLSGQEDARIRVRVRLTLDRAGDAVVFDGVRMLAISRLDNSRPDRLDRTPPQSADEPDRDARDGAAAGGPRTDPGADDPVGGGASEADRETDRPGGASEADRETDRPGGASPTGGEAAAEERASEGSPLPPSPDERLIIPADPSAAAP